MHLHPTFAMDELVRTPLAWMTRGRRGWSPVISTRIRLARNLRGFPFPGRASPEQRAHALEVILREVLAAPSLQPARRFDLGTMHEMDREILVERHVVSKELADNPAATAVVVREDETVAVMINEEDHLRLQVILPGLALEQGWTIMERLDRELERVLPYAFDAQLGYLTACPSNVGTGLRASVLLHLPCLKLWNEADAVARALNRLDFEVRGLLGEGSDPVGGFFQVSNRLTLGVSESEMIRELDEMARELVRHENNARQRLVEHRSGAVLRDYVGRAFGILRYAQMLNSGEAIELLSALRIGVECRLVAGPPTARMQDLLLLTQPGHLRKITGRDIEGDERDELRVRLLRGRLAELELREDGAL